ncbi:SDR family NAD(P)-dependent oxidoreductase [Mycobacterium sp.]|uniref:SDR family NAD(P)-dependent oxidoreductase n=1 Tax=Mycobacterium sp. TaxID=1785 RepID=UPI002CFD03F3|nr:SDR family NAD(P)-dependent oxidoreductase [Mycobacterium sp.]HKP43523.1 SDR family NAD(P)-dependent oxidoreductase [Mycobacterium sp.]
MILGEDLRGTKSPLFPRTWVADTHFACQTCIKPTLAVAADVDGTMLVAELVTPEGRERLAAEALNVFGQVDVLINNAGIGWSGPLTEMDADDIRRLIEVDLLAPIELTRALLPGMAERRNGAICFVTSIAGRTGVAEAVVRTVVKDRAETWIPGWLRIAPAMRALAPGAYRRLVVRFG